MFPCAFSRWSPGLGDNNLLGWVTVAVYLLAAAACLTVALRGHFPVASQRRERLFWWLAGSLLLFLAVNKQLDLQSLLTAAARCMAVDQGWYEDRRIVQREFIICIMLIGILGLVGIALILRGTFARTGIALLGLGFVTVFVVVRAVSFHQVDLLINTWLLGIRVNWLLELPGPLLVILAAFRALSRRPS
jgi:hypothetical protein